MRRIIASYTRGGLTALYRQETGDGTVELLLLPAGREQETLRQDCAAAPLVQAKLAEDDSPAFFSGGRTLQSGPTTRALAFAGQQTRESAGRLTVTTTLCDPRGHRALHTLTLFADNPAAELTTRYENGGDAPVTLELLTSFTLGSLSPFSAGLAPGTLRIHRMRANWSAEGRLVTEPAEALRRNNAGVGVYVIDAGWFDDEAFEAASRFGKWQVSRKAFPRGLGPVVEAIHAAGMQAGVWFEFEVAGRSEPDCFAKTEWQLRRDGRPITVGDRRFWDFRTPAVVEYLAERVIGFLRRESLDYIKIDYNEDTGPGCDGAESPGEALRAHIEAVQRFYARIRRELPGVTVELCASGGHRLCHSFLELACMASFSDAHECDEIPVIAANMHRILLPRQNQIWAVVRPGQSLPKLYYQLCSGLLGRLCLSGDAESWRADQWAVIRRGVAFYRQAAPVIDRGRSERLGPPVRSYRAPAGWQAVVRRGAGKTLVVLHTFAEAPEQIALPVGGTQPAVLARPGLGVAAAGGCLTVTGLRDFDAAAILLETEE